MKRREFITLLGGAAATWPIAARGQQTKMLRIGTAAANPRTVPWWMAFFERLRELGYVEGENLTVDFIDLHRQIERQDAAMRELVHRNVDIIVAAGAEGSLKAAVAATKTIPIVMLAIDYDPISRGYVASLSHPGTNITGVYNQQVELPAKRLQLLKQSFPDIQTATVFWDKLSADQWRATQSAGTALGIDLYGVELHTPPYDYEQALAQVPRDHHRALVMMSSPLTSGDSVRIADFALRHQMISLFAGRRAVEAGALLSYGSNLLTMYRIAASYIDRIAHGERPSDLPIQQPTKFELVINLKTARALGLSFPPSVLALADEVIE